MRHQISEISHKAKDIKKDVEMVLKVNFELKNENSEMKKDNSEMRQKLYDYEQLHL